MNKQEANSFTRLESLIGTDKLNKLKTSTVLVVGIGGVGGYTVESLARSGIGKIIIVDFDTVDITNINRQIIATTKTIGLKKVDVMEERIKDINPVCSVIKYPIFLNKDNIEEVLTEKIDFIIDCCDSVETKKLLLKEATMTKINFIASMGTANKMNPSMLEITTIDKTYNDPLARIMRKYVKDLNIKSKIMVLSSRELPKKNGTTLASNAFVPSSAGLLITSHVINKLIK